MSEYLAGVTILPLGNGLADLLSGLRLYKGDTSMVYNEMLGSFKCLSSFINLAIKLLFLSQTGTAIYITGFVGGLIFIIHPHTVLRKHFIWHNISYLIVILWIAFIMNDELVYWYESVGK